MSLATLQKVTFAEHKVFGLPYSVYVNTLLELGITSYEVRLADQRRLLFSPGSDQRLALPGLRLHLNVSSHFDMDAVKIALYRTQTGQSDYPCFLTEMAEAGVHHYFADLIRRVVTYYNEDETQSYAEAIP